MVGSISGGLVNTSGGPLYFHTFLDVPCNQDCAPSTSSVAWLRASKVTADCSCAVHPPRHDGWTHPVRSLPTEGHITLPSTYSSLSFHLLICWPVTRCCNAPSCRSRRSCGSAPLTGPRRHSSGVHHRFHPLSHCRRRGSCHHHHLRHRGNHCFHSWRSGSEGHQIVDFCAHAAAAAASARPCPAADATGRCPPIGPPPRPRPALRPAHAGFPPVGDGRPQPRQCSWLLGGTGG